MTDPSLRHRYEALRRLAEDQAGHPEGATAARLAAAMLERYPTLEVPEAPPIQRVVAYRHEYDRTLLAQIAAFLGLEAYRVGHRRGGGKGIRWRRGLQLEGTAGLVDLAETFYAAHRARLDELLEWTAIGYAVGAFPKEEETEREADPDCEPLDPALLEAALAARSLGQRHQAQAPIPEDHLITEGVAP